MRTARPEEDWGADHERASASHFSRPIEYL
jgi:hypothetical protein